MTVFALPPVGLLLLGAFQAFGVFLLSCSMVMEVAWALEIGLCHGDVCKERACFLSPG